MSPPEPPKPGAKSAGEREPQLLHLVFGGQLESLDGDRFVDPTHLDIVGIYPNYRTAYDAWRGQAQRTVDDARMRYYIVHLHRLLEPERP